MNNNISQGAERSYNYTNGRVSVLSLRLLSKDKLVKAVESGGLSGALKILYEANYADGTTVKDPNDYEKILKREWDNILDFVENQSAEKAATDCFLLASDIHNLKILMKQKYLRLPESGVPFERGLFCAESIASQILNDEYSFLPKEITSALEQIDKEFYSGSRKPAVIDALLSRAYYKTVKRFLKKCKSPQVKDYFVKEIDGKNILSLFRVKKAGLEQDYFDRMFIEGGKLSRQTLDTVLIEPEKATDLFYEDWKEIIKSALDEFKNSTAFSKTEVLLKKMQRDIIFPHKSDVDGILPLINYFLAKKTEIENLRTIFVCLKNKIDKDKIMERLRELYV